MIAIGRLLHGALNLAGRLVRPLDPGAFRLFLAMLVFVHHFSRLALGSYAVMTFFVLSGYWVQTMWVNKYRHTRSPYWTYIVSRFWRLIPLLLLVSLLMLVARAGLGQLPGDLVQSDPRHLAVSSLLLLGYAQLPVGLVGPAWSLDIEMQFYLIAPLIAAITATRWFRPFVVLTLAGSLFWALAGLPLSLGNYLAFFVIGVAAARFTWRPSARIAWVSALTTGGLVLALILSPWRDLVLGGAHRGPLFVYNEHLCALLTVLTVPFAIHTVTRASDPTDRMMADLSYAIYLVHAIAVLWFYQVSGPFTQRLQVAAISFAVVPIVSWLIWRYFDKPVNRARNAWVNSRLREGA